MKLKILGVFFMVLPFAVVLAQMVRTYGWMPVILTVGLAACVLSFVIGCLLLDGTIGGKK